MSIVSSCKWLLLIIFTSYVDPAVASFHYLFGLNYARINSTDIEQQSSSSILSKPIPEVGLLLRPSGSKLNFAFEVDYRYINFLPDAFQKIEHDEYSSVYAEATMKIKNKLDLIGFHYGLDDLFYFYRNFSATPEQVTSIKLLKAQFIKLSVARTGFLNQSELEFAALYFFLNQKDADIALKENYGIQFGIDLQRKSKKAIRIQYQIRRELYLFEDNIVQQLRFGIVI